MGVKGLRKKCLMHVFEKFILIVTYQNLITDKGKNIIQFAFEDTLHLKIYLKTTVHSSYLVVEVKINGFCIFLNSVVFQLNVN